MSHERCAASSPVMAPDSADNRGAVLVVTWHRSEDGADEPVSQYCRHETLGFARLPCAASLEHNPLFATVQPQFSRKGIPDRSGGVPMYPNRMRASVLETVRVSVKKARE
jgi:hypothetical protein